MAMIFKRWILAAASIVLLSAVSHAKDFPTKPIVLIVPFAAGGVTDAIARVVSLELAQKLGQPVVVENRAGGGGRTGTLALAKMPADGYALLLGSPGSHSFVPLVEGVGYDAVDSFSFIGPLGSYPLALVCNPKLPAKDLPEFIAYLKSGAKKVTFANAGMGSMSHFTATYLSRQTGAEVSHVPYRGSGAVLQDLVAGHVDCSFDSTSRPFIADKSLRAYAITGAGRDPLYPGIPSLDEVGLTGFGSVGVGWQGLFGPKGIDPAIVTKLNSALNETLKDPKVDAKLKEIGFVARGGTPEDLRKIVQDDTATYVSIAKEAGITLN